MQAPALPASLNAFDWFLLLTVLFSTLMAFRRGIVRVLFSLGGLVAGLLFAAWNYTALAGVLTHVIPSEPVAEVIAFLLILVIVTVVATWAARFLRQTVAAAGLGIFDRLFGAIFGFLRGMLLGVSVLLALTAFAPNAGWLRNSVLAPYFLQGAHAVSFVVPESFQQKFMQGTQDLLRETSGSLKGS